MQDEGAVRVDDQGRLYLPLRAREKLEVKGGDFLDVFVEGKQIILRKRLGPKPEKEAD